MCPAGETTACVYNVTFNSSVNSVTNFRVRLVNTNQGEVQLRGSAASAQLAYKAELIPEPPVARNVTISAAASVTEGEPLVFTVGLPGPCQPGRGNNLLRRWRHRSAEHDRHCQHQRGAVIHCDFGADCR